MIAPDIFGVLTQADAPRQQIALYVRGERYARLPPLARFIREFRGDRFGMPSVNGRRR